MKPESHILSVPHVEEEWIYVPNCEYLDHGGCKRSLQLIVPFKHNWDGSERYPLVLFIPGSAWMQQEMYNGLPKLLGLAKKGVAIAAIQYRESSLAVFPEQIYDIKAAIRFVRTPHELFDFKQFRVDTDDLFIAGDSSGGHLAMLTGLTCGTGELDERPDDPVSCRVNGILSYCAPSDMFDAEKGDPTAALFGTDDVEKVPELARQGCPEQYVSAGREIPPVLMFHGAEDFIVSVENSRKLFAKLRGCDKDAAYYELPGENHCCQAFWEEPVVSIAADFIRRNRNPD